MKNNNFDNYKNYYKECIKSHKDNLKKKFDEILLELENYENEDIENISDLFEEKVNMRFELPIELSFIERFQIAINRKIMSLLNKSLYDNSIKQNFLNLFQNELSELKFSQNNPNDLEKINLKSPMDFKLLGIGIPKIPENNENPIEVRIYNGISLIGEITEFENYENFSIGYFDSNVKIEKNSIYTIEIKGLANLDFISNEETYNDNSKIEINSSNEEKTLACLIIE